MQVSLDTTIRNDVDNLDPRSVVIMNQQDREAVSKNVQNARFIKSRVVKFFEEMKANAYKTWKGICSMEKGYTDKCDEYEKVANQKILAYDDAIRVEQERLAREADEKRQAEEKARQDAEAARRLAEDAEDESTVQERETLLREAAEAEQKAADERAAVEQAQRQTFVKRETGETVRTTWKARVIDIEKVPRFYMIPNQSMLDAVAKSNKDQIKAGQFKIEGVEFFEDRTIVRKK